MRVGARRRGQGKRGRLQFDSPAPHPPIKFAGSLPKSKFNDQFYSSWEGTMRYQILY